MRPLLCHPLKYVASAAWGWESCKNNLIYGEGGLERA